MLESSGAFTRDIIIGMDYHVKSPKIGIATKDISFN